MDSSRDLNIDDNISELLMLFDAVAYKQNAISTIKSMQNTTIANTTPDDIVILVHKLMEMNHPMPILKTGISKILNVLRNSIDKYPYIKPASGTFFDICVRNNEEVIRRLNNIRPYIKLINNSKPKEITNIAIENLITLWTELKQVTDYYLVKENIIFPLAEDNLEDYRCVAVMWSIHDDIRKNLNKVISLLRNNEIDLKQINRVTGDLFFDIHAMVFREEKLLYPYIEKNIDANLINALWNESIESGLPFYNPAKRENAINPIRSNYNNGINLRSGFLSVEQIILLFNHLPVDITFVDENDKVRFFSTPKDRIFHRSNAIIGRDVHNCHPHESVHIVEKIIKSFREGRKDNANFWINMSNGKSVYIQYFAIRDDNNEYKGVLEVTQEVSDIRKLDREKRILDWED